MLIDELRPKADSELDEEALEEEEIYEEDN